MGLYRPFHSFAVLCLRLCVRRLPGEFAVRGLRALERWLRRAVSRDARGRRIEVLFRAARAIRPRRKGSGLLENRPFGDRAHDRRTGDDGVGLRGQCSFDELLRIALVMAKLQTQASYQAGSIGSSITSTRISMTMCVPKGWPRSPASRPIIGIASTSPCAVRRSAPRSVGLGCRGPRIVSRIRTCPQERLPSAPATAASMPSRAPFARPMARTRPTIARRAVMRRSNSRPKPRTTRDFPSRSRRCPRRAAPVSRTRALFADRPGDGPPVHGARRADNHGAGSGDARRVLR